MTKSNAKTIWRGRRTRIQFLRKLQLDHSVIGLQSLWRRHEALKVVQQKRDQNMKRWRFDAATKIQSKVRVFYAKQLRCHLKLLFMAATTIQSAWRGAI